MSDKQDKKPLKEGEEEGAPSSEQPAPSASATALDAVDDDWGEEEFGALEIGEGSPSGTVVKLDLGIVGMEPGGYLTMDPDAIVREALLAKDPATLSEGEKLILEQTAKGSCHDIGAMVKITDQLVDIESNGSLKLKRSIEVVVSSMVELVAQDAEGEGSIEDKATSSTASSTVAAAAALASPPTTPVAESIPGTSTNSGTPADSKKKSNRCQVCRKRVGLTGVECRCGGLFCHQHRYSDEHSCTFDYRQLGAEEIRKNNPVVVGEKIQKI